jgi:chromosome segregation ATPase
MQSRDVLAHATAPNTSSTDRLSRSVATVDSASAPLEEELRRFLGEVRGVQPGAYDAPWRGLAAAEATETDSVAVRAELDEHQSALFRFLEPLTSEARELPPNADAYTFQRRSERTESHAPELAGTRAARAISDGGRGTGSATEMAMVSAVERAMAAFKAEASDLTLRLQTAERAASSHAQRVHELELERSTVLKTAEYLEAQRASLADEIQLAWAAHERDEQARLALQAALSEAQSSHASELAAASEEIHRVERSLRELESVHTETLALNAALRIEVERLGARYDDARAAAEADRASLDARTQALDEATIERAKARDTLRGVLADLDDLSSWARAKSARLTEMVRPDGRAAEGRSSAPVSEPLPASSRTP